MHLWEPHGGGAPATVEGPTLASQVPSHLRHKSKGRSCTNPSVHVALHLPRAQAAWIPGPGTCPLHKVCCPRSTHLPVCTRPHRRQCELQRPLRRRLIPRLQRRVQLQMVGTAGSDMWGAGAGLCLIHEITVLTLLPCTPPNAPPVPCPRAPGPGLRPPSLLSAHLCRRPQRCLVVQQLLPAAKGRAAAAHRVGRVADHSAVGGQEPARGGCASVRRRGVCVRSKIGTEKGSEVDRGVIHSGFVKEMVDGGVYMGGTRGASGQAVAYGIGTEHCSLQGSAQWALGSQWTPLPSARAAIPLTPLAPPAQVRRGPLRQKVQPLQPRHQQQRGGGQAQAGAGQGRHLRGVHACAWEGAHAVVDTCRAWAQT